MFSLFELSCGVKKVKIIAISIFVFYACGSETDCCLPEVEPPITVVIKDWEPREELLIEGPIFTVSYNEILQQPNWIRYNVRSIVKNADRDGMRFYEVDSVITSDDEDYYDNPWDRGHLAPAGSFTDSYENLYATFSFLNCTLQKDQLNRGEWAYLEDEVRTWASEQGTLTVDITLHYNEDATVLPTGATIPTGYTKSIVFPDESRRCFYFPNEDTTMPWQDYEIDCSD